MPNGVICGGAVDGSNQLGERVTCHAMTARPDGAAAPAVTPRGAKAMTIAHARARGRRILRIEIIGTLHVASCGDWSGDRPTIPEGGARVNHTLGNEGIGR